LIDAIRYLVEHATDLLQMGGPIMGVFLVVLESIIPILPLGAFITLNMNAFGHLGGFLISWSSTCFGCYLSYLVFSSFLSKYLYQFLSKKDAKKIKGSLKRFKKMSLSHLVVLIALPFTPAFLINITAGLANVSKKKFLIAILVGKLSIVYFWGVIGTSFLESMTDIKTIMIIAFMLIVAYFVSKYISKKTHIE